MKIIYTTDEIDELAKSYAGDTEFSYEGLEYRVLYNVSGVDRPPPNCQNPDNAKFYDTGESREVDDMWVFLYWNDTGKNVKDPHLWIDVGDPYSTYEKLYNFAYEQALENDPRI
jgi:hypothetical protein